MHVLIQTPHKIKLVVIPYWLTPTEFLRLTERALIQPFDFRSLCVVGKSVGNPAIVTPENNDFRVRQREGAYSVTG